MRVIRKIVNGNPDEFWTGSKFDSDINRATEIKTARQGAAEKRLALEFVNKSSPVSSKTSQVAVTLGYEDASEDNSFTSSYQMKRNNKSKLEDVDASILDSKGQIDSSKLSNSFKQKLKDKKEEIKQRTQYSMVNTRKVI